MGQQKTATVEGDTGQEKEKTENRAVNNLPAYLSALLKLSPYRESPISLLQKVPNMLSTLHFPLRQKPKSIPPDIF